MKTLIALSGVANQGKSTSIKIAYDMIKTAYPKAHFDEIIIGVDITVVITIDGVKVGIESQGDPGSRLFRSLDHFVKVGCKVIVCATRTRGATVDAVSALSGKYNIIWLNKTRASSIQAQGTSNRSIAQQIFNAVKIAISA